jgi:glycine/D-amino acid oxidase-like deaminating enzyme
MDLKTGNLLWPAISPTHAEFPRLDADIRCETAIIGGGITGAMLACSLADEGVDVVLVDKRQPAEGSTSASSALVLYEIDQPMVALAKKVGPEHAQRAYLAVRRALDDLAFTVKNHDIDCDLTWRESLFLGTRDSDLEWFADEVTVRRLLGIEADLLDEPELRYRFGVHRPGAIHSAAALSLDPYRLTLGLIDAAVRKGMRAFGHTSVEVETDSSNGSYLQTDHGPRIECDQIIVATGYETPELFHPVRDLCSLKSTYVVTSHPMEREPWPKNALIWESAEPYLYARQTEDGRVIIGGEDEPIVDPERRDALIDWKAKRLCDKFGELCPGQEIEPDFVWAGTFAETADGLPYIGTMPRFPGCHFALGYGGNGITYSMLAAQIITDSILGRSNPDGKLFRFDR